MFSVSVKHKKEKEIFLHIDLIFPYQGNKTRIKTLSVVAVQSSMQLQQKETETGSLFNIYCHDVHN